MHAIERQVVDFEMPGTGIPGFAAHAGAISRAGIYDLAIHHDQILVPVVLRHWGVEALTGLDDEAERSRDRLMARMAKSERVARRVAERRAGARRRRRLSLTPTRGRWRARRPALAVSMTVMVRRVHGRGPVAVPAAALGLPPARLMPRARVAGRRTGDLVVDLGAGTAPDAALVDAGARRRRRAAPGASTRAGGRAGHVVAPTSRVACRADRSASSPTRRGRSPSRSAATCCGRPASCAPTSSCPAGSCTTGPIDSPRVEVGTSLRAESCVPRAPSGSAVAVLR